MDFKGLWCNIFHKKHRFMTTKQITLKDDPIGKSYLILHDVGCNKCGNVMEMKSSHTKLGSIDFLPELGSTLEELQSKKFTLKDFFG